jgi:hypothetical protein
MPEAVKVVVTTPAQALEAASEAARNAELLSFTGFPSLRSRM